MSTNYTSNRRCHECVEAAYTTFHAIAHPLRMSILEALSGSGEAGLPVSEIAILTDTSQSMVSVHLKILHRSNLVIRQRRGNYVYYAVNRARMATVAEAAAALSDGLKQA